jgi:hypothetical protein
VSAPLRPLPPPEKRQDTELRAFLHVVYRALKMVTAYLEKTYGF